MASLGLKINFDADGCTIHTKDELIGRAIRKGNLYKLDVSQQLNTACAHATHTNETDAEIWHHRLGHIAVSGLNEMIDKKLVSGLDLPNNVTTPLCTGCALGKVHRSSLPNHP